MKLPFCLGVFPADAHRRVDGSAYPRDLLSLDVWIYPVKRGTQLTTLGGCVHALAFISPRVRIHTSLFQEPPRTGVGNRAEIRST